MLKTKLVVYLSKLVNHESFVKANFKQNYFHGFLT